MNGNAELLNFIYQNSQMGTDTLSQLLEIAEDPNFREYLKKQLSGYEQFHRDAKQMLNDNGYDEKGIGTFDKMKTYLMINFQTMSDKSTTHLAEMLIVGGTMGIIEAIRDIRKYQEAEKDILKLMKNLQKFEEDNTEKLKEFL